MNPVSALVLASLFGDAGVAPDASLPLWAPRLRRADLEDAAYGLHKWGEGYIWENSKFEAHVGRDGVVTFKDKHGSVSLFPFGWLAKPSTRQPSSAGAVGPSEPGNSRRGPWLQPPRQPPTYDRKIPQEEMCPPGSSCYSPFSPLSGNIVSVSGSFDLTDEIMRMLGQDPYSLEKARFLSATFEFRIKLAIEARRADMKNALDHLPSRLDELWGDGRYTARERRRILYEIWYEVDRTPDGERAAKIIDDFIRRRLPCGSPDSYTGAELEAFSRSHPGRRFAPTDECAGKPEPPQ